jgi:hypothetical protein
MKKNLQQWKDDYLYFTEKASEINRNLALGGIAVVWIFKNGSESNHLFPTELTTPLLLLVLSLSADLIQYILGGIIWFSFFKYHEACSPKDKNLKAPNVLPLMIHIPYFTKLILTIWAYCKIGQFLFARV